MPNIKEKNLLYDLSMISIISIQTLWLYLYMQPVSVTSVYRKMCVHVSLSMQNIVIDSEQFSQFQRITQKYQV